MTEDFEIMKFSADGMIHAVQPMVVTPRGGQRAIHHDDSTDDPYVCLNCTRQECYGSEKCYRKHKKAMEKEKNGKVFDA